MLNSSLALKPSPICTCAVPDHGGGDESNPAAYCDIQGYDAGVPACVELDLLEGNAKAIQATLHTFRGHGFDGHSCNQDGCTANWGKTTDTARFYGPNTQDGIDSTRPFEVSASFREIQEWTPQHTIGALMDVTLSQADQDDIVKSHHFFDGLSVEGSHVKGSKKAIPSGDKKRTRDALISPGVKLVVSLWTAEDLSWLDGGCESWAASGRPSCDLASASFKVSNLRISEIPSPPPSMPPPSPPLPPPPPPPSVMHSVSHVAPWILAVALTLVAASMALSNYPSIWPREHMPVPNAASVRHYSKTQARGQRCQVPAVVPSAATNIGHDQVDDSYDEQEQEPMPSAVDYGLGYKVERL